MDSGSKRRQQVDRISELSDTLACHILSYLPIVDAVWTTVLSKRWNNLWKSLPNLEFDEDKFPIQGTDRFIKFVDRVLSARGPSDLQKLYLHIHHRQDFTTADFNRLARCIRAAVRQNIVELDLFLCSDFRGYCQFKLPLSLFKCKSLKVLRLYSDCITYPTPKSGCFRSLKVFSIYAFRPCVDSLQKLFSHFPVLEDLTIVAVPASGEVLNINISAPELKTLAIYFKHFSNNCRHPNNCCINAPKLENLEVTDGVLTNYILGSTNCLIRAVIQYCDRCTCEINDSCSRSADDHAFHENVYENEAPEFSNRAAALLARMANVKCLTLDTCPKSMKACCLPDLENLSKLDLGFLNCYNWKLLTELLKRSPKLEYLGLEPKNTGYLEYFEIPDGEWNPPESVPVCLLSSLKTIFLKGYRGKNSEKDVAKYLLRNGKVLNTLTISTEGWFIYPEYNPYEGQEELSEQFSHFSKGSETCEVQII